MRFPTSWCLALGASLILVGAASAQTPTPSSGNTTYGLDVRAATVRVAPSRTYTFDADFAEGTLVNVNYDAPNNNQLQLNEGTAAFPFVNVAASSRGTIIRANTDTGEITGEYYTSPAGQAKNPSRTTVDQFGNVWVGNRDARLTLPNEVDRRGTLTRVGLIVGGTRTDAGGTPDANGQYLAGPYDYNTCVDSDSDGLIKTSRGLGDYLPWTNAGLADSNGGVSTAEDECILNYTIAGGPNTRTIAIDQNNDVWVGGTGSVSGGRMHERVDGTTGDRIIGSAFKSACGGYGGFIDGNNVLWSMTSGGSYLRYDLTAGTGACLTLSNYGTGVDPATGEVWISQLYGAGGPTPDARGTIHKVAPDGTLLGTFNHGNSNAQGVVVDGNGNVWVAHSLFGATTVGHLRTDGTFIGNVTLPNGSGPTGVAVDADGKVWVANINTSNAMRINPNAGPIGADGVTLVGEVDLTVNLNMPGIPNAGPYNYSDMTGSVVSGTTAPSGTWTVVHDGTDPNLAWSAISWTASVQAGQSVTVEARAANAPGDLGSESFVPVSNGTPLAGIVGRYIEVRATLARSASPTSPILFDLTVTAPGDAGPLACSQDRLLAFGDFDIDGNDPTYGEFAEVTNSEGQEVDLTPCSFATFNPLTERVIYTAPVTGAVGATSSYVFASQNGDQVIPLGSIADGPVGVDQPGALVLLTGTTSVGASVADVLPNVVAGLVYRAEDDVYAAMSGGGSASAREDQRAAFVAALAQLSQFVANEDVVNDIDLAVAAAPNPMRARSTVSFGVAEAADVRVAVYDALGREVALLAEAPFASGRHELTFEARGLPAGVYVVRAIVGAEDRTARVTITR